MTLLFVGNAKRLIIQAEVWAEVVTTGVVVAAVAVVVDRVATWTTTIADLVL